MTKDKISTQEIIDLLASKVSISKRASEEFLKVLIASVEDALLAGDIVKIKNFGTFKLHWNEPRKSVNIQTGEEIILSGYYKVIFAPDTILKDLVNEPFGHLEAIVLDTDDDEIVVDEQDIILDPLRIFTEQASEIKNLLSEIQSLSKNQKVSTTLETPNKLDEVEPKPAYLEHQEEIIEIEKIEEPIQVELSKDIETDKDNQLIVNDETASKPLEYSKNENISIPVLDEEKPLKKRKRWLLILIVLVLIGIANVGLYLFYSPVNEWANTEFAYSKTAIISFKNNISFTEMLNTVTAWVTPASKHVSSPETVVVPKDTSITDSIDSKQPIDSLQLIFDNQRIYTEYIASERLISGSRLARISKRYYGTSDFWVYIYEANKDRITNPDNIAGGTLIHIPKLNPRLIDATNPRCIEKARELHDLYVTKK